MALHTKYKTILTREGISTPLRLAHFFAQLEHESNLKPVSENLNYSASALIRVFKKYFTKSLATKYARNPEAIANRVYANRMDNGNEASGDGWKYRGRGFIQITGKANYTELTEDTGIDYINNPDLLLDEVDAMISAIWFWKKRNLNYYADNDDVKMVTKRINGGYNGLEHRTQLLKKYKQKFNV